MKQVYEFLKIAGTYYIATVEDNQPRVRPFGTVNIFEDKLYIQTGKTKNFTKQVEKNNKVEICAFNGDEWLRLSGELIRDDRVEAGESMLNNYPELRSMYKTGKDGNSVVFYFQNATAIISSFTHTPIEIKF